MRFLHIGDVHLGTTFRSRPEVVGKLADALRRSVEDIVDIAAEHEVDAVLIAGDLFESAKVDDLSLAVRGSVITTFQRLGKAGVRVFIAPGNHDPMTPASVYRRLNWPDAVHLFESTEPEAVDLDIGGTGVTVHGVAHTTSSTGTNLVERIRADRDGRVHLALVHCNVQDRVGAEQEENYAPCVRADFPDKGIHYWALGHIHAPEVVHESVDPPTVAAYCGCLCGLGYGDLGPRGCTLVTVEQDHTVRREFLPTARLRWEELTIALEPDDDADRIPSAVRAHVESLSLGDVRCCLRVRLTGRSRLFREFTDEEWQEQAEILRKDLGLLDLEFHRELRPPADIDDYADQPHILGELIGVYRSMLETDDETMSRKLQDVLGEESLRRIEAEHRRLDDDETASYRRGVLERAMDELLDAFTRET